MAAGWVRWILERFEFDFHVVYAPELDQGDLASRYDVLIFVGGGIPAPPAAATTEPSSTARGREARLPDPKAVPAEYHDRLGRVTVETTVPQLKKFVEDGGTMITIGSSIAMARHLGLPIANALVDRKDDGTEQPLGNSKFYVPGSVLCVRVDNTNPLAYGLPENVDVYFQNSPVMRMRPDAMLVGIKPLAWFDSDKPLRSGWAWGQHQLKDGVAAAEAPVGKGTLLLFGPEITFRAQPHGTFKFLFNGIYYGPAKANRG